MTALTSLKQLHYLVALAEQLNFTRAAELCFVTQSTLSAGLKELEDMTGSAGLVARPMAKPAPKRTIALIARRSTPRLADMRALIVAIQGVAGRNSSTSEQRKH